MKSIKSLVKPACAIALVLGMSSPWFAYAKEDNCRPEHHHMGPHPKQFKKLVQALDLSEEQKVQAQALQAQMKADREADKGAVQAQREAFHVDRYFKSGSADRDEFGCDVHGDGLETGARIEFPEEVDRLGDAIGVVDAAI